MQLGRNRQRSRARYPFYSAGGGGGTSPMSLNSRYFPDTATTGTTLATVSGGVSGSTVTVEGNSAFTAVGRDIRATADFATLPHGVHIIDIRMSGSTTRMYRTYVIKYANGAANSTVTTEGELDAAIVLAKAKATSSPYVIDLNPATAWAVRNIDINLGATDQRVIFRTTGNHISGARANIDRWRLAGTRRLMFQNLQMISGQVPTIDTGAFDSAAPAATFGFGTGTTNIDSQAFLCRFVGGYNANRAAACDPATAINPTKIDYKEYCNVLAVYPSSNGRITSLQVWPTAGTTPLITATGNTVLTGDERAFIGNNTPDGNDTSPGNGGWPASGGYSLVFKPGASGSGAVARIRVNSGYIDAVQVDSFGTNYNASTGHPATTCTWVGRLPMLNRLPAGITRGQDSDRFATVDCEFNDVVQGMEGAARQEITLGNNFQRVYADSINRSGGTASSVETVPQRTWFNIFTAPFSRSSDPGNPHTDNRQTVPSHANARPWYEDVGNLSDAGSFSVGAAQLFLYTGAPSTTSIRALSVGNFGRTSLASGFQVNRGSEVFVHANGMIGNPNVDPAGYQPTFVAVSANRQSGSVTTTGTYVVSNTYGNAISTLGAPNFEQRDNSTIALGSYGIAFTNPTVNAMTTATDFVTNYATIGPLATIGPFVDNSCVDHVNRNWRPEDLPVFAAFGQSIENTASATVESNVRERWYGGSAAISISNGEWRKADNVGMSTNVTAWSSSAGTLETGKFYQVRGTAGASPLALTTVTATIGAKASNFRIYTADTVISAPTYPNPGASTFSRYITSGAAIMPAETNIQKMLFAISFRTPATLSATSTLFGFGNNRYRLQIGSTGSVTLVMDTSTTSMALPAGTIVGSTNYVLAIMVDRSKVSPFTEPDGSVTLVANDAAIVVLNGVDVTVNNTNSWSSTGSANYSFNASTLDRITFFASQESPTPSQFCVPGYKINWVWWDWRASPAADYPDIRDYANFIKFSNDQIGATGQGPLGTSPKIFYQDTPANFNASSVVNKGTITQLQSPNVLTTSGGAYV